MTLAPFRPRGVNPDSLPARLNKGEGLIWQLTDGGWAFQYPNMSARVEAGGRVEIAWTDPEYSVAVDADSVSYHAGNTVVHRDVNGNVIYHQPSGTMHRQGDEVIYHWCNPNVIVYQTPDGIIYYDDQGITYRGKSDLAHYSAMGEVLYQGIGGITYQKPDGSVTHWTESGVIYSHTDGVVTYTPVGESEPQVLSSGALPAEAFPGPPLTATEVLEMVNSAIALSSPTPATSSVDNAVGSVVVATPAAPTGLLGRRPSGHA